MKINWVPKKSIHSHHIAELLNDTVRTGQFTNYGPNVRKLEQLIRKKLHITDDKAIICVNNGTAALHALVEGIQLYNNKNMTWATQSFTFPPSAQGPLRNAHIIDIDAGGGIDLEKLPDNVDGIIVTNIFGQVVDIKRYINWAQNNNCILLFDNAATPFTFYDSVNVVNYGHGSIISFHHTKPLGFGEGGAIIVDKKYEKNVRQVINFGIDPTDAVPTWNSRGSNYKMSDIAAAYIIQYFSRCEQIIAHHQKLYTYMKSKLIDTDIRLYPSYHSGIPFISCFTLLSKRFSSDFMQECLNRGIYCRKYYEPLIKTPVATNIFNIILCIPCTIDMHIEQLDEILTYIQDPSSK